MMNNWKDIIIAVLAFLVIGEAVFVGVFLLEKPEPIVKREIVEKLTTIEHIIIAKPYQKGIASWYGEPEHGGITASGEVYDMHELTVAHPNLPFGTRLLVTNRRNGKSVVVTVTDKLPKVWVKHGRIIDMSYGSAKKIGMVIDGLVPVDVMVLELYND